MQTTKFVIAALAVLSAALVHASNLGIGDPAPPITVTKWVQGSPVKSGLGGLRVVEFWATWCGPCKESIPHLTEMSKKYAGKVVFTGIDVYERSADDVKTVQSFVKSMGDKMTYNVAVDGASNTMGKTWMEAAHQLSIPTAFVIDKTGVVVWIGHPMSGLDTALDQILAGTYNLKKAKAAFDAQVASEAASDAEQNEIDNAIDHVMANYKSGMKANALAAIDNLGTRHPAFAQRCQMVKFQMLITDNKAAATKLVETEAAAAGKDAPYAYLQFAMVAAFSVPASKEDLSYAVGLGDQALKMAPKDPIAGLEASIIYQKIGDNKKAISLAQDALKNLGNAPAEYQDKLKASLQQRLTEFQAQDSQASQKPSSLSH